MMLWLLPMGAVLMSTPLLSAKRRKNFSASRAQQHGTCSKHPCVPACSGWSVIACVEMLWSQSLPYSPSSFPLFSNATVSNSLFLQPPPALIRLEAPGRFSVPEILYSTKPLWQLQVRPSLLPWPCLPPLIQSGPFGSCS